eukprot:COSAG02_NODE_12296_length_1566_cov_1.406953_1_plen_67_part_10
MLVVESSRLERPTTVGTLTVREPKKGRHSSRMPVALMSAENHERGKQEFTDGEMSTIPANPLSRLLE